MGSYSLVFKPSVEDDLRKLPKHMVPKVLRRIEELSTNPFPRGVVKLTGAERLYRLRVGVYRVVYEVDAKSKRIVVHYVRHRREAYR